MNDKQGVFYKDENGSLLHPSKACAVLSRDAKLTPRGAGRLLKWKISQSWILNLPKVPSVLEIRPSQYVISLTKESWELVKVLMCIKLCGSKFLRVDSILQGNKDSFAIVQAAERTETANKFTLSTLYSFRCAEQVVLTVIPSEQKDRTLEIKSKDVEKIKESIKGRQIPLFYDPKRPSKHSLPDSIIFYKNKLCDNTVEELKYFCKKNLMSTSGTKSELISRVFSNLKNKRVDLIELHVRKMSSPKQQPVKGKILSGTNVSAPKPNSLGVPSSQAVSARDIKARSILKQRHVAGLQAAQVMLPAIEPGLCERDITLVNGNTSSCPLSLHKCPCERITLKAANKLRDEINHKGTPNSAGKKQVQIVTVGIFDQDGVMVLKNYCYAATCRKEIDSEKQWFSNTLNKYQMLTRNEISHLQNIIWNNHVDHNVCKVENMEVKVSHLLSLCCERYLNDQIIDAVIKTFWLKSSDQVRKKTICLTTFTCIWASLSLTQGDPSSTRHLQQHLEYTAKGTTADDLRQVLVPVHINNSHWGITRIFIPTKTLLCDDSLKWAPPRSLISELQYIIRMLSNILPTCAVLKSRSWSHPTISLQRFSVPVQPSVVGVEGSASCGVAVCLAAKNLILEPDKEVPSKFRFRMDESWLHRINLMKELT